MWPFRYRVAEPLRERLDSLAEHLPQENPVLVAAVGVYRDLDQAAYQLGLLPRDESLATRISWWPLVSVLGTFSAGKSTFINEYLDRDLQLTGNQAVDEKFTVICYSGDPVPRTLPGMALNADPRFPLFEISREIERVSGGEGRRIDSYLQLKTCDSERIRGKILIDSPGFDADDQRSSTLRITSHIIDLSDLVLVLFDARHPEPGAMQDTLEHLVGRTVSHPDANKFLYVLNQIDTAAQEDNPEQVVGAWQRALANKGLTAGRFYSIYAERAAVPIEDPNRRERFKSKRDADLAAIRARMEEVGVERAYRILGNLQTQVRQLHETVVPALQRHLGRWRRTTLAIDGGLVLLLAAAISGLGWAAWDRAWFQLQDVMNQPVAIGVTTLVVLLAIHLWSRRIAARWVMARIPAREGPGEMDLRAAFRKSTRLPYSALYPAVAGWTRGLRRRLDGILRAAGTQIQRLNDQYADPSGQRQAAAVETTEAAWTKEVEGAHSQETQFGS
ncbi:dynamin family protein [Aquisalimonas sp.]|uniref:dynamin family protein n=1 Tax=Aquisalimonas sp. TaxID=1872621 RepID=UPI0025B857B5|nr:dynamin family protein [Aquisalimonas sp.]